MLVLAAQLILFRTCRQHQHSSTQSSGVGTEQKLSRCRFGRNNNENKKKFHALRNVQSQEETKEALGLLAGKCSLAVMENPKPRTNELCTMTWQKCGTTVGRKEKAHFIFSRHHRNGSFSWSHCDCESSKKLFGLTFTLHKTHTSCASSDLYRFVFIQHTKAP